MGLASRAFRAGGLEGVSAYSPWEFDEIDPAGFDPEARLQRMDEYGIAVQVLYPNLIGFKSPQFISLGPELSLLCTQVYNDFALEWASVDPRRLVPVAMLPFWDLEASITEMERTRASGHRGVLFANKFEQIGLPHFCDPHWNPIYSAAQSLDMPINYHIGFSSSVSEALSAESVAVSRAEGDADQRPHALESFDELPRPGELARRHRHEWAVRSVPHSEACVSRERVWARAVLSRDTRLALACLWQP